MECQKRLLRLPKKVHDNHHSSVVLVIKDNGSDGVGYGSGFIIKSTQTSALVVTCSHVINAGKNVRIRLAGSPKEYRAAVIHEDAEADLAILRVRTMPRKYPELLFCEKDVRIGMRVFLVAYYNPLMIAGLRLDSDVYPGKICALMRKCPINPEFKDVLHSCRSQGGCSGGPLIYKGRVIGIHHGSNLQMELARPSETFNKVLKKWLYIPDQEVRSIGQMIGLIKL